MAPETRIEQGWSYHVLTMKNPTLVLLQSYLDALGVSHSAPADGHLGWYVEVPDPDGLIIQLHTIGHPTADEA